GEPREELFRLSEKSAEPTQTHAPPPFVTRVEPQQMGERRVILHKVSQLPLLIIGYHVPPSNSADTYALNILRTALFQGESSRMYQRLVDQDQIALGVTSSMDPAFDPTLTEIVVQPKQG